MTILERRYGGKMRDLARRIRTALYRRFRQTIEVSEVDSMSDDKLRVSFMASPRGLDEIAAESDYVDVSITMLISEHSDGELGGINWGLDVVRGSGEILGGLTPYNYTDQVWVARRDRAAVETRWSLFRTVVDRDVEVVVNQIATALGRQPRRAA